LKAQANVLFIVIDQLRADCIFGEMAQAIHLPTLTSLMDDAVTFKSHFSVTNPCGPSRASLLTGQYAMNHQSVRNGTPLKENTPNLATKMRELNYDPMLFGYTDTTLDPRSKHISDPLVSSYEQVMPGFNEKLEMRLEESYPWRSFLKQQGYQTPDYSKFYYPKTTIGCDPKIDDPAFYSAQHSDSAFLTDQTLNGLSVRTNQSWFAHVTYIRPHPPLVAPKPYNTMYKNTDFPDPIRHLDKRCEENCHPFLKTQLELMHDYSVVDGPFSDADKDDINISRSLRALYLGLISEVDHQIGRLIRFLKETNQYDSTLIVITADHGEMLGDHHLWGKQTIYDKAIHIPLIIRDPNSPQTHAQTVEHLTESIDVTPSILQWAGLDHIPRSMNGRSLIPFLQGNISSNQWRSYIFNELDFANPATPTLWQTQLNLTLHQANVAIIRDKQYKLVHFNAGLPPLLFDIENDPNEMKNLADDNQYAGVLLSLTQCMLNHKMTYVDHTLCDMHISEQGITNFN
jgi:arylsulfatase A-like enzyme